MYKRIPTTSRDGAQTYGPNPPTQYWHFLLSKIEDNLEREISHFNNNSKDYDKCKFAFKLIWFSLFPIYFH